MFWGRWARRIGGMKGFGGGRTRSTCRVVVVVVVVES